jgi:hypothetical protein
MLENPATLHKNPAKSRGNIISEAADRTGALPGSMPGTEHKPTLTFPKHLG